MKNIVVGGMTINPSKMEYLAVSGNSGTNIMLGDTNDCIRIIMMVVVERKLLVKSINDMLLYINDMDTL